MELCDINANGAIDREELQPMIARWVQLAAERAEQDASSFDEPSDPASSSASHLLATPAKLLERSLSSMKSMKSILGGGAGGGSAKSLGGTPRSESSASGDSAATASDTDGTPKKPPASSPPPPPSASRACVLL